MISSSSRHVLLRLLDVIPLLVESVRRVIVQGLLQGISDMKFHLIARFVVLRAPDTEAWIPTTDSAERIRAKQALCPLESL